MWVLGYLASSYTPRPILPKRPRSLLTLEIELWGWAARSPFGSTEEGHKDSAWQRRGSVASGPQLQESMDREGLGPLVPACFCEWLRFVKWEGYGEVPMKTSFVFLC